MQPEDSKYLSRWVSIAENDLRRVQRDHQDDPASAGFFLQQAIEKLLKAFLLSHGRRLRKIHDLPALLDDAAEIIPELQSYRGPLERITQFYMSERYPSLEDEDIKVGALFRQSIPSLPRFR